MKRKFVLILTALVLCLSFMLSACGETGGGNTSQDDHTYYTVTFDAQGGSNVESKRVLAGNPVPVPATPTRENFDFKGWYRGAEENAALWNFTTDRVNQNITLYAHWTAKQEAVTPTGTLTFEERGEGYAVTGDSGQAAAIVIPEEHEGRPVVAISDSAFAYSRHKTDITSISIPDSVTEIGKNAFHNQDALVSVYIGTGSGLQKIGNNAFSGNSALQSIYLPAGLTELGDDVFNNCGGLDSITVAAGNAHYSGEGDCLVELASGTLLRGSNHSVIPETVTKFGVAAFRKAQMTTLTIPKSVTYIDKYAVSDSAITKIVYKGTAAEWDALTAASSKYWNMGNTEMKIVCSDTATAQVLVAYFSATGNTKGVAEKIATASGGTLYEITPKVPYTAEDLRYSDSSTRATVEQHDSTARPQIEGSVSDMGAFDVVYLGYPIWWGEAPKIIYTFLESYDFSGKTIIPFCTSGSSGIEGSLTDLKAIAPAATWLPGHRFPSTATQSDVTAWLNSLN